MSLKNDTIHCTDDSALQDLVPYVNRSLQLFPGIEEFRNRFYQCETSSCIERMKQNPLDFKPDALRVRKILDDE